MLPEEIPTQDAVPEEIPALLKALADSNRLRIFEALMRGTSCNGWLTAELGLAPNLLSHHLKVLRETGLIQDRRDGVDGRWIYYQVNLETLTELYQWLVHSLNPALAVMEPNLCGPEGKPADDVIIRMKLEETAV